MKDVRLEAALLVSEISALACMINAFTDYCVFFRFSGHVNSIDVEIARSKQEYKENDVKGSFYLPPCDPYDNEDLLRNMKLMKLRLKKILRDKKIDYSQLNYDIEEVRHYKLI
ncbi:hypothetical protein PAECIP111893_02425 [Paenibacillus plantiphilus]|uniref:Uncharacterized protein n=1 Tax=Paenibacillus plantiphilus TaxID=2905650 RepID=A0ABM9C9Z8_9BACL|nr:hypothetical protein [Paenibacillus plantiphilus]CAH1205808.1 hypothetical protein PAECIP111893_02425 [Paenibacillus plantiphilus]